MESQVGREMESQFRMAADRRRFFKQQPVSDSTARKET